VGPGKAQKSKLGKEGKDRRFKTGQKGGKEDTHAMKG